MDLCHKINVSAPWDFPITDISSIPWQSLSFPCIVKPSLASGGRKGVYVVAETDKLEESIQKSLDFSLNSTVELVRW